MTTRRNAISIYINPVLAEEYARRRASSPLAARLLSGFPSGPGDHKIGASLACLMLEDAEKLRWDPGQRSVLVLAYKGLIKQIERRLPQEDLAEVRSRTGLALVFHSWAKK